MSDARQQAKYDDLRTLSNAGWEVHCKRNHILPNDGSETDSHLAYKAAALAVLTSAGYRVASEVSHDARGEIDIVAYGHPERELIAIELEHEPDPDVLLDKVERYVQGTPISECYVVVPQGTDVARAAKRIQEETGL